MIGKKYDMINIMFCGNKGVFDGALTCALSILKRSELSEPINFYMLTMDVRHLKDTYVPIEKKQIEFFEGVIRSYNPSSSPTSPAFISAAGTPVQISITLAISATVI